MSGQPFGDRRDVVADLVALDDAQGLVRPMILQQRFETFCGRQVLESQRALAAVLAPQHAVGVSGAVFLGVDACHSP